MPAEAELSIVRLGAQGDGVAETATGPVFVPGTLPGELVRAAVDGERGRLTDVLRASGSRIAPACRHFGTCGGCAVQHLAAAPYLAWKRDLIRSAFSHRGLEPPVEETVAVPPGSRRRAVLEAERSREAVILGYHEAASRTLVDLGACPVLTPALQRALPGLRVLAAEALGPARSLRLTATDTPAGLDVAIDGSLGGLGAPGRARLVRSAAAAGVIRLTAAGDIVMQSAVPALSFGGSTVALPPGAFIQASAEAEAAIAAIVSKAVGKARRIADLFCGLGTFALPVARHARVLAVDGHATAIAALKAAVQRASGLKPLEARVRDLFREPLSRKELEGFDAVVLDPPRAGAKAQAEALAKSAVPVVVAVSCNPATLARDVRTLVDAGFAVESVTPIDQFLWSPHVEAVAVLRRRGA